MELGFAAVKSVTAFSFNGVNNFLLVAILRPANYNVGSKRLDV